VKAGGKEDGEVVPEGRVGCSTGGFGRAHGRGRDSAQDAEDDGVDLGDVNAAACMVRQPVGVADAATGRGVRRGAAGLMRWGRRRHAHKVIAIRCERERMRRKYLDSLTSCVVVRPP
jgi:hypothetical protein